MFASKHNEFPHSHSLMINLHQRVQAGKLFVIIIRSATQSYYAKAKLISLNSDSFNRFTQQPQQQIRDIFNFHVTNYICITKTRRIYALRIWFGNGRWGRWPCCERRRIARRGRRCREGEAWRAAAPAWNRRREPNESASDPAFLLPPSRTSPTTMTMIPPFLFSLWYLSSPPNSKLLNMN